MMQTVYQSGTYDLVAARAVSHPPFRHIFHESDERSRRTNRMKALRWWRGRNDYINKIVSDQYCQLYITSLSTRTVAVELDGISELCLVGVANCSRGFDMYAITLLRNVKDYGIGSKNDPVLFIGYSEAYCYFRRFSVCRQYVTHFIGKAKHLPDRS